MTLISDQVATTHKTYFISDLHLNENQPNITGQFFKFLNECDNSVDAIYILGDLFEAWIGDDDKTPFHLSIMNALKKTVTRGIPVYFLAGNRDFLIGQTFARETGVELLQEEHIINVYGQRVLLMHGDTLCIHDTGYQKIRPYLRNQFLLKIFLWLPLNMRRKIADKMRDKSMQYTKTTVSEKMNAVQSAIDNVMQRHQASLLIHGHTHQPGIHAITSQQSPATRVVLGAWHDKGSAFVIAANGQRQLIDI